MSAFIRGWQQFALLVARIGLGVVMIAHAWQRWQITGLGQQVSYLTAHGVPWPSSVAWATTIGEGLGGVLLIVGLLTPLVGLGVLVEQILIICWTRWYRGLYLRHGGFEYEIVLGVLALILYAFGAGRISVDNLFRRGRRDHDDLD